MEKRERERERERETEREREREPSPEKHYLISHASKVMLKIPHARPQQYVNHELLDVQAGFRKGTGTRDQIASIC